MSTCWMNERLCRSLPRAAPVLNELWKKKKEEADPEEGLAELWASGFEAMELFSRKHKCIQCCPIYNHKK